MLISNSLRSIFCQSSASPRPVSRRAQSAVSRRAQSAGSARSQRSALGHLERFGRSTAARGLGPLRAGSGARSPRRKGSEAEGRTQLESGLLQSAIARGTNQVGSAIAFGRGLDVCFRTFPSESAKPKPRVGARPELFNFDFGGRTPRLCEARRRPRNNVAARRQRGVAEAARAAGDSWSQLSGVRAVLHRNRAAGARGAT